LYSSTQFFVGMLIVNYSRAESKIHYSYRNVYVYVYRNLEIIFICNSYFIFVYLKGNKLMRGLINTNLTLIRTY